MALANMAKFAEQRRGRGKFRLLPNDGYIRVNAAGFRAVSVSPEAPLCKFGSGPALTLDGVLNQIKSGVEPNGKASGKLERSLQAFLIRAALQNDLRLFADLQGKLPYERILLALDEVRLPLDGSDQAGGARCDLLAVGKLAGAWRPVVIELKWDRKLTELVGQLDAAEQAIHRHAERVVMLLEAAVGEKVRTEEVGRMIVWPRASAPNSNTRKELERKGVIAVTFDRNGPPWAFALEG